MGTYKHLEQGTKSGGPADSVIILLHGMGSSAERTLVHAPELGEKLPNAHFYAPDASNRYVPALDPKTADMSPDPAPGRFMWYSRYSEDTRKTGLYKTLGLLDAYISECAAAHNLDRSRVVTVGISQGAIVSDFCLPRFKEPIGATISHKWLLVLARLAGPSPPPGTRVQGGGSQHHGSSLSYPRPTGCGPALADRPGGHERHGGVRDTGGVPPAERPAPRRLRVAHQEHRGGVHSASRVRRYAGRHTGVRP